MAGGRGEDSADGTGRRWKDRFDSVQGGDGLLHPHAQTRGNFVSLQRLLAPGRTKNCLDSRLFHKLRAGSKICSRNLLVASFAYTHAAGGGERSVCLLLWSPNFLYGIKRRSICMLTHVPFAYSTFADLLFSKDRVRYFCTISMPVPGLAHIALWATVPVKAAT